MTSKVQKSKLFIQHQRHDSKLDGLSFISNYTLIDLF